MFCTCFCDGWGLGYAEENIINMCVEVDMRGGTFDCNRI